MTPYERRNARARELGFANYYQQRLHNARQKHGATLTTAQARGHSRDINAPPLDIFATMRSFYDEKGGDSDDPKIRKEARNAAFRHARRLGLRLTHDQWGAIFGSPAKGRK